MSIYWDDINVNVGIISQMKCNALDASRGFIINVEVCTKIGVEGSQSDISNIKFCDVIILVSDVNSL